MAAIRVDASLDEETVRHMLERLERLRADLYAAREALLEVLAPEHSPAPPEPAPGHGNAA